MCGMKTTNLKVYLLSLVVLLNWNEKIKASVQMELNKYSKISLGGVLGLWPWEQGVTKDDEQSYVSFID